MLICRQSDRTILSWASLVLASILILSLCNWPTQVLSKTSNRQKQSARKILKCGSHKPFRGTRVRGKVGKGEFPFLVDISVRGSSSNSNNDGPMITKGLVNNDLSVMFSEQQLDVPFAKIFNCSGAIISRRRILTSIKCISSYGAGILSPDTELPGKNSARHPNVTYEIKLGSTKHKSGRPVSTKGSKIFTKEYQIVTKENTAKELHGLAIIKLRKRINYSLKYIPPTSGSNNTNGTGASIKSQRTSYSINRVCFSQGSRFPDDRLIKDTLYAPSWYANHKRAKVMPMNLVPCPDGISNQTAICVNSRAKRFGPLQEGSPLVRYKGKMRWELIGIRSGLVEEPRQSECPNNKCRTINKVEVFIPLHAEATRQWLTDELYRQKLGRL